VGALTTGAVDRLPDSFTAGLELIALRALSDREDARDAAQETMARALEAVRRGRVPAGIPLAAFVHGIARHVIADVQRRRLRERGVVSAAELAPAPGPTALDRLIDTEERERLRSALRRLPATDRDLLEQCFVHGERVVDIATRLGEPAERVRKRKSRALLRLRQILSAAPGRHIPPPEATFPA
jgi:RNA polymerase sigma-70 factor (ECF subfamily)